VSLEGGIGDEVLEVRMEQFFLDQLGDGCAFLEDAAEADVGTFEERGIAGLLKAEELPHLIVRAGLDRQRDRWLADI